MVRVRVRDWGLGTHKNTIMGGETSSGYTWLVKVYLLCSLEIGAGNSRLGVFGLGLRVWGG